MNKLGYRRRIKQEFYEDFLTIYWSDDIQLCDSATIPYYYKQDETANIDEDELLEDCEMIKKIKINTYNDIKKFVAVATKYGDDLIIKGRNYTFPACSLMSVMSLVDLSDEVKIQFNESICADVLTDFGKWIVDYE